MDTVERGVANDSKNENPTGRLSQDRHDRLGSTEKGSRAQEDLESGQDIGADSKNENPTGPPPPIKGLSWLDRLLVVWIILAMAIGIIIGNLAPSVGPALQQGEFIGVSAPIAVG